MFEDLYFFITASKCAIVDGILADGLDRAYIMNEREYNESDNSISYFCLNHGKSEPPIAILLPIT